MTRLLLTAIALSAATGCIFIDGRAEPDVYVPPPPEVNYAPVVDDAMSACLFDGYDDIFYIDAWVSDANGPLDVVSVWADLYDDVSGERLAEIQLYPTDDAFYWTYEDVADRVGPYGVNCWYGLYSVDVWAYDSIDQAGGLTIFPQTY